MQAKAAYLKLFVDTSASYWGDVLLLYCSPCAYNCSIASLSIWLFVGLLVYSIDISSKSSPARIMHTASQQSIPGGRHAMSKTTATICPEISCSDMKYFAYKLGYLSRVNIRLEARKAEPHLFKLLGHATLFDNARNYINQHLDDEVEEVEIEADTTIEWAEDEDEATIEYVEDIEDHHVLIPDAQMVHSSVSSSSKETSLELINKPQTLSVLHASPIESLHSDDDDWDNDSNTSTEAGDDDEGHWSDTTCEEDDVYVASVNSTTSDPYLLKSAIPAFPNHKAEDDDIILWSQQPRVLSLRQVEDMFVEAFG